MIIWCCYCQTYIGEKPPLVDYSLSHSICQNCKSSGVFKDRDAFKNIELIRDFFNDLLEKAESFEELDTESILYKGKTLGIKPLDIFYGIVQPAMWEIGRLTQENKLTVAKEHMFTSFAQRLLIQLSKDIKNHSLSLESCPILIIPAPDNVHTIGVQALGLDIVSKGYACRTIYPGIPDEELKSLILELRPEVVCLSVAVKSHFDSAINLSKALHLQGSSAKIIVGGPFIHEHEELKVAPNLLTFNNMNSFYDFLREKTNVKKAS
jgi:methanogenic corrinoid protein MtbC1